jgi:hypothetical protein
MSYLSQHINKYKLLKKMKKFNFTVDILLENEHTFWNTIYSLNETDTDLNFETVVLDKSYNPENKIISFTVYGSQESYNCFLSESFIQSIN